MIYNTVFLLYTGFTAYFCLNGLEGAILILPFYIFTYLYWFEEIKRDLVILCSEDEETVNLILDCVEDQFHSIQLWKPNDNFKDDMEEHKNG